MLTWYQYHNIQYPLFIISFINNMLNLEKEIDFTKQLREQPELEEYMKRAINAIAKQQSELLAKIVKPTFDQNMQNHLMVTQIPDITNKQDKFLKVFNELLDKKKIGTQNGLKKIQVGYKKGDQKKISNQTLYLIYNTGSQAKKAYKKLHQLKFTNKNTLQCFTVKQFHTVENMEDQYNQPTVCPKEELINHNIDQYSRDQIIYRSLQANSDSMTLKWLDNVEKGVKDVLTEYEDNKIQLPMKKAKNLIFSERGSYLAVCSDSGVELYMGEKLRHKTTFNHKLASNASFSPNQKYLVTYSDSNPHQGLVLWAIEQQVKIHSIRTAQYIDINSIQFNKQENKIAIIGENQIYIYDCSTFQQLKESLKMSEDELIQKNRLFKALNVRKIMWMPDNINLLIVCYQLNPTANSHPTSKIYFFNTETKEQRKWKAIGQHIKKVEIVVSESGDWVAVSFKKIQKKNQSTTSVYIVNFNQKQNLATQAKDFKQSVCYIAWDRRNSRFGLVFQLGSMIKNPHVNFGVYIYQIQKQNVISAVEVCKIAETPLNRLILPRNGLYFAMYNVTRQSSGRDKYSIGFLNKAQNSNKLTIQYMKQKAEVGYMKFFDMDPSGRFIIFGTDKTFQVWSMDGEQIFKQTSTYDIQNVQFRPTYYKNISIAEEKQLLAKQKDIKKKFQQQDLKRTDALRYQRQKEQQQRRQNFKSFLQNKKKWFQPFKSEIAKLRGFNQWSQESRTSQYIYYERPRA